MSASRKRTIRPKERFRSDTGSALVEFSLVLPAFMLVLIGSLSLVWLLGARSAVSGAARDGARYASIQHDWMDCPASGPCDTSYPSPAEVASYVEQRAGIYGVDAVTVTPTAQPDRNQVITVTATRQLPSIFGAVASLFGVNDIMYTSTAVARAE